MSYADYNFQYLKKVPKIEICKPDRTTVGIAKEAYDITLALKFSAINELQFSIPAIVERNFKIGQSDLVSKIKERYLVRLTYEDKSIEYFSILKINKAMGNDGYHGLTYSCYSLGIQIANTLIRNYEEESLTLSQHAKFMLQRTAWKLDYVEVDFDLMYRAYSVSSNNALQCLFELAEKFNAALVFNTDLRTVSFHHPKNVGKFKGFSPKYGVYLESFNVNIDAEKMVTRLRAFGSDNLDFRRLSPTGSDYIEDYSFYMYPFKADSNWNVLQKSKYMSDSLCIAILKYQKKLESLQGQFESLTDAATKLRDNIQNEEQILSTHEAKQRDLLNQRDVINYTYGEDAPNHREWQDVIAQLNETQGKIDEQNRIIASFNTQLDGVNGDLKTLHEQVRTENNFTSAQILEWVDYQNEKEYYNDSIISDEDLLKEAKIAFKESQQPPVTLDLSLENFLLNFDVGFDKKKLELGDEIELNSKELNVYVRAKITEINMNYETGGVNIMVSNTTYIDDDFKNFIKDLNLASNTSTTVNIDKIKWNEGREAKDEVTEYLNNALDAAKQLIQGGLNGSVTLSERGLVAVDLKNPNAWLMIQNGQLFITPDNGNTVSVAINKDGVFAERLVGRIILGNKLHIEDEAGVVTIYNAVMTVYDLQKKKRVELGRYADPSNPNQFKYGLRIYDGAIDIRTSDGIGGIQFDKEGFRAYNNNGVKTFSVNARTGEVEIAGSLKIKTHPDDNRGVVIDGNGLRGYNASGKIVFQIDNYGNAWFAGRLESAYGSVSDLEGNFHGKFAGITTGTLNAVDGTFTGTLRGVDGDFSGYLRAATGEFQGLVTGSLSFQTMQGISIDAQQITSGFIRADKIQVDSLSAISANLGTIYTGYLRGVNIDTDNNIRIGNMLSFNGTGRNEINFGNGMFEAATINGFAGLSLEASLGSINITSPQIYLNGSVYVNGRPI